jgi:hypothetical protein
MEENTIIEEIKVPDFNPYTQYLGEPVFNEDTKEWFYSVMNYSDVQIKNIKIQIAESQRQSLLKTESEKRIVSSLQILSDTDALANKGLYPIWERLKTGYQFALNEKVNALNNLNEMLLFKVIQAHTKLDNWHPLIVPNLFSEVKIVNGVEVWKQPIGGDGKYPYINPLTTKPYQVSHKDGLWENTHTVGLNVWEPSVFGWKKI